MDDTEKYMLKIIKLDGDKEGAVQTQMTIDEDRIKAVCAAGLGLAQPRERKPKLVASPPTPKAVK